MPAQPMTIPLWSLVAFILWTVCLVAAVSVVRLRHLAAGGSVRDFGIPDERRLLWRLFRAHLNCLENLPLFASIVLLAAIRGVAGPALDTLAVVYVAARFAQSTVHVVGFSGNIRFACLIVQLISLLGFTSLAVGFL